MDSVFFRPSSLEEALSLLEEQGQQMLIVNGGTDAVLNLVEKKEKPQAIMHIAHLPGFHEICEEGNFIKIGGAVTYRQMLDSALLRRYRGLIEAVQHLASPPIRELATPAGNICTAAPSADCTTMLLALKTEVHLRSKDKERLVPLHDFFTGTYQTVRQENELLDWIRFPRLAEGEGSGYCRLSRRKAQNIGKVLVGARLSVREGIIRDCSIALGALNAYAVRAYELEEALTGKTAEEALRYAAEHFPKEARLRESYFKAYKEDVVSAAVERALAMAILPAKGEC